MKSYKVVYKKEAIKFIKLRKLEGTKFFGDFEEISKDITKINLYDIKNYHTSEIGDFFRLRIAKYRAIFKVNKDIINILVLDIGSRGDIYKSRNCYRNVAVFCA
ncbi:type II toxin-antitoxin system RelE/ParE family toxin [Fusobacterium nucleatum]|uniref:type II toxin-antitoxin system RelE family toxin n=1 Tax=Fusobacterium nucleatum TaxID=851 RepID=UPI003D0940E4